MITTQLLEQGPMNSTIASSSLKRLLKRARSDSTSGSESESENEHKRQKTAKPVEYHDKRKHAPIFIQKTYEMINTCNPAIASWTDDGSMFSIKDQKLFAQQIIPQFFDHSNFSSFSRQLNFYVFRKIQARAIYKDDYKENAKYVTFFNKNFHRDRPELLKFITRTTNRTQNNASQQKQQQVIDTLREKVDALESMQKIQNDRIATLEALILSGASQTRGNEYSASDVDESANIKLDMEIPMMRSQSQQKRHESALSLRGLSASSFGDYVKMSAFDKKFLHSALFEDGKGRQASAETFGKIDLDSVTPL